jgi:CDP-diacylglycerol---glycerol-3-phosphate 3-phosphatidyltransferase
MTKNSLTVPTILTLTRLIFSPLFLPILLVLLLPYDLFIINIALAALFVLLSLTDFFDGYLARKYQQETMLGRLLDPLADKFLFFSTLIALLAVGKIFFYWAIIFIGREFFVLGLRIFALEHAIDISVSWRGKIKTAAQLAYATIAISNPFHHQKWSEAIVYNSIEWLLLALALLLSWWSAYYYYKTFIAAYRTKYNQEIHSA